MDYKVIYFKIHSKNSVPVVDHTFTVILGTSSTLHRDKNGLTANFKTKELITGNAYTLWWVIWNNPENCLTPGSRIDQDLNPANFGLILESNLLFLKLSHIFQLN